MRLILADLMTKKALVSISPNPRQNRILFQKLRQHDSKTGACCRVHQI